MRIYLDNSATTRPYPEVVAAMCENMTENWGNPSGIHSFGRDAYDALQRSREQVAALINADPLEIYFTSGGTEADNLAISGVARRFERGHIITSAIEHHAVLRACERLEEDGFSVTYLMPDEGGRMHPESVAAALRPDTLLVSIMHANNEIGTIQPIADIGRMLSGSGVLFHTDAVQSAGKTAVDVKELGVDMLTLSGHKINGPKGVGALFVRHGVDIEPVIAGGGQERGLRSGTENMPGIVGLGVAAELTRQRWQKQAAGARLAADTFLEELKRRFAEEQREWQDWFCINGIMENRLPGNLNLSFYGVDNAALLLLLDMAGVAVSAASACSAGSGKPSHVLRATGLDGERLRGAVRFSFGWQNTVGEAVTAAGIVAEKVRWLRDFE